LTIEIDPKTNTILQIKAKYNNKPHKKSLAIIEKWMQQEGIKSNHHQNI
jgi:hypothetical protein